MKSNDKGFTFVELIATAGMIGLLSLSILSMDKLFNKAIKRDNSQQIRSRIVSNIQRLLTTKAACENTFSNLDPNGAGSDVPVLNDTNNNPILTTGQIFRGTELGNADGMSGQVRIVSMAISDYESTSGGSLYYNRTNEASFVVRMERVSKENIGNKDITERFKVRVNTSGGLVNECYGDEDAGFNLESICDMFQGTYELMGDGTSKCRSIFFAEVGDGTGERELLYPIDTTAYAFSTSTEISGITAVGGYVDLSYNDTTTTPLKPGGFGAGDLFSDTGVRLRGNVNVGGPLTPSPFGGLTNAIYFDNGLGVGVLGGSVAADSLVVGGDVTTGEARMFNANTDADPDIAATIGFLREKLSYLVSDNTDDQLEIFVDVADALDTTPTNYVCALAAGTKTIQIRGLDNVLNTGSFNSVTKNCDIDMEHQYTNCQRDEGETSGYSGTASAECTTIYANQIQINGVGITSWDDVI
jgi:type II secretory pathway pseudopilin PulG